MLAKAVLGACLGAVLAAPARPASYEQGLQSLLHGDFKISLEHANAALQEDHRSGPAYALRARVWAALGDAAQARRDADSALELLERSSSRLNRDELVARSSALLSRGQAEQALPDAVAALRADADFAEGYAARARVWRATAKTDKALEDLGEALARAPGTPLYLYARAGAYYDLGRHDEAVADLTAALRANKAFYPAYGLLGTALAAKRDLKRAAAAYNKALTLAPEYSYAYVGRAALNLSRGDERAGFEDLDSAVRVGGGDYASLYNRAEAHWERGDKERALGDFRRSLEAADLTPDFAVKIGDRLGASTLWKEALSAYTRAYELAGGGSPSAAAARALIRRARGYEAVKDLKRAMRDLDEAVERAPTSGTAWAARGLLALRLGRDSQAAADLEQAILIDPGSADARVARGGYYARVGKPKSALEDFNKAIELDPRSADAYNNRGALLANALGDREQALKDLATAVALAPQEPSYRYNLGMLRLHGREYFEAVELFGAALKSHGPPARILAQRAEAWSQLGDSENAQEDVQVALEKDPRHAPLYGVLADMRMRGMDYEQAVRELNHALELDARDAAALTRRGQAYGALGSIKRATQDFARAAEIDPGSKEAFAGLCQARRLGKDAGAAAADCSKAIELDPRFGSAYLHRGLAYLAAGQPEKTVEDIDMAFHLGERRAEGLLAQSVAHAYNRQYRQAHKFFEAAMRLDPSARSYDVRFGISKSDADDYFNVISDLEPIMRSDGSQPYAFILRGDALRSAEHFDKAAAEYTKAMELDGTLADAYLGRGECLLAQDALDAAQQDFLRALELGASAEAHVRLATLLTLKKDYRGAIAQAVKALKLEPKNAEAFLRAGNAYYFLNEFPRALGNYRLAVRNDPFNPSAYNGLGLGHFALRQHREALESFSRAIALNPRSGRFWRNRGSTYANMGRFINAAAEFRNAAALNTDPAQADAYRKLIEEAESHAAPASNARPEDPQDKS